LPPALEEYNENAKMYQLPPALEEYNENAKMYQLPPALAGGKCGNF
jgi:hypothetical protein